MQQARQQWKAEQPSLTPARLVFLDETGAATNMTRRRGRAPRGQRCVAAVPHGHHKMTTFIAALRHDGITAPCVIDGPMDGAIFLAYVRNFLCPTLKPARGRARRGQLLRPARAQLQAGARRHGLRLGRARLQGRRHQPRLAPLAWIVERTISTPATHFAHHTPSSDDGIGHPRGNYGNFLFFWDVLFGAARITRRYPERFGLPPEADGRADPWYVYIFYPLFRARGAQRPVDS